MFDSRGVRAAGDALVWGVGGSGGRADRPAGRAGGVDQGVTGRAGGAAAAGGPGLHELLAAAEHGRAGREGEGQGGRRGDRPGRPALTRRTAVRGCAPPTPAQAGWAAGASRQQPGPGGHPRPPGAGRAVLLRRLRWRPGRGAGNGRRPRAGVRPAGVLPGGDRVSDDAPGVWLRTGHHSGSTGGDTGRTHLLRPERDRGGDPAGQPGRAGHRAHRGPDVRAARGGGVHRVHLLLPDPPGHRVDHGRVRTGAQDGAG